MTPAKAWLLLGLTLSIAGPAFGQEVNFGSSVIRGVEERTEPHNRRVEVFRGIPYAVPPVKDLRFQRTTLLTTLPSRQFTATTFGPSCIQPSADPITNMNEDCLTINVFREKGTKPSDKLPVVVIIHAGTFYTGSSALPENDGRSYASHGKVIAVTFNYRLGIFGFMHVPSKAPGNVGLHDQQLALQWVKRHIALFGGDPNKVTLYGTAAGAMSVQAHIMAPSSAGLFSAAVMDSGALSLSVTETRKKSTERAIAVAKEVGCPTDDAEKLVTCLQGVDATKLHTASTKFASTGRVRTFMPVPDGDLIPTNLVAALKDPKKFNSVRLLIGTSRDEGTFGFADGRSRFESEPALRTEEETKAWMQRLQKSNSLRVSFKYDWRAILTHFIINENKGYRDATQRFLGTGLYICPAEDFARRYASANENVYLYKNNRPPNGIYNRIDPQRFGAHHTLGSLYMVGGLLNSQKLDKKDEDFIEDGIDAIIKFADNPKTFKAFSETFPKLSSTDQVLLIGADGKARAAPSPDKDMCTQVWYRLGMEKQKCKNKNAGK